MLGIRRKAGNPTGLARLQLAHELSRALAVSEFRTRHRAMTLRALSARIIERTTGNSHDRGSSAKWLGDAQRVRYQALELVKQQESGYRYSLPLLAGI